MNSPTDHSPYPPRNSILDCTQLPKFDLRPWKLNSDEDEIHLEHIEVEPDTKEAIAELSPELIEAAVERAKQELEQRKRFEYEVWRSRKSGVHLS